MACSLDIHTDRLLIAPFQERHLTDTYIAWLNNRELMKYSEQRHHIHSLESCRNYMQSFNESPNFFWAVEYQEKHIGNINAYVDENNRIADLGILIGSPSVRGKGLGTEAWLAVCRFLFREKRLRKITAGTLALNIPMLRLMEKAGMQDDGRRERHYLCEGLEVDIIYKALFSSNTEEKNKVQRAKNGLKLNDHQLKAGGLNNLGGLNRRLKEKTS